MAKLFFVLGLIACSVAFAFKSHSLPVQARASVSRRGVASLKAVVGVDDKEEVREYFNTNGFERWNKIYSDSDEVNKVQLDIRTGHQQTIDKVLNWISQDGDASKRTFCDCGCGTGALAIPLVEQGAKKVDASDISSSMADEAARRAKLERPLKPLCALHFPLACIPSAGCLVRWRFLRQPKPPAQLGPLAKKVSFSAADLESVSGKYDTVTCIDVMIHYPTPKMYEIVNHLGSLSTDKLILSFAPDTWYYSLLKKVGELFPGPSKTTRAYLHPEADVRKALQQAGFKIQREEMTGTNFYFSRLLEAVRE